MGNHLYLSELLAATIPMVHVRNGDLDAASESAKEGMDLAAQIGSADNEFYALRTDLEERGLLDRIDKAIHVIDYPDLVALSDRYRHNLSWF